MLFFRKPRFFAYFTNNTVPLILHESLTTSYCLIASTRLPREKLLRGLCCFRFPGSQQDPQVYQGEEAGAGQAPADHRRRVEGARLGAG